MTGHPLLPSLPPEAREQGGPFLFRQAVRAGWMPWQVEAAHRAGLLTELAHGVFIPTSALEGVSATQRHLLDVRAQQLSSDATWYAARRSAAVLHGLPLIGGQPSVPQLVRDPAGTKAKGHSRHARVSPLPKDQRLVVDGIPVCTPARAVVDIARQEPFRNGVVVADAALRAGTTRDELLAVVATQRRWPGLVRAKQVVRFADGRAESPGESVTRAALHLEGLEIPEPQVEVWRYGVLIARLDFLYRAALLALESDGALKFTESGVLPDLLARSEQVRDCGIAVLHTHWDETFRNTEAFGRRVRLRLRETHRRLAPGVELRSTALHLPQAA